jgi:Zn-dependent protease
LDKVGTFLLLVPILLFSMIAHEYAHGYAALRQGDPTAYQLGRLTWNPIKHIDPFMTVLLPLFTFFIWHFAFGGAKPVPVNPRNYKKFKRGDIIVSMAGIVTNFVIAVACTILAMILGAIGARVPAAIPTLALLQIMLVYGIFFNLLLAFFNLIPIPPLDGSHVVKYLLPPAWALQYQRIGQYGLVLVFALAFFATPLWMTPVVGFFRFALSWVGPFVLPGVGSAL